MKNIRRISLICLISLIGYFAPSAKAQSAGLSISPPVVEVLLSPNKSATQTFVLKNEGEDTSFSLAFHKLIPTDSLGHSTIDPTPLSFSNLPITATIQNFELNTFYPLDSGATVNLTVLLQGATVEEASDLYLALVISLSPREDLTQSTTIAPGISALILTTIPPVPAIPTDITLSDFDPPALHDTSNPLTITPMLQNNSPIMLNTKGVLSLTSPFGKVLSSHPYDQTLILGHSTRTPKSYILDLKSSYLGPHKLKLTILTESGRTLIESEKTIFFAPIRLIIFFILALLTFALAIATVKS